ncbi:MAG: hypothetical protein ACSHX6_05935 [Akkermansiaceae bacterium]
MTDRTKAILLSMPFVIAGLVVLFLPKMRDLQDAKVYQKLVEMPLKSKISTHRDGQVVGSRHTFSMGEYGVTDVGNLRIVIKNLPFSGSSKSSVVVKTDVKNSGRRGASGVGNRRFETFAIPGGSRCIFGGMEFQFTNSELHVGGEVIGVTGPPTLVLIGEDRAVIEIREINIAQQ